VFTTTVGSPYESHNLRRDFRKVTAAAGLGARRVPKELRNPLLRIRSTGSSRRGQFSSPYECLGGTVIR
jgi:hypothetical protein